MLSAEATNNKITVFGLTRSGVEPMIYHTRGKHANHYTTNEVTKIHTSENKWNHSTSIWPLDLLLKESTERYNNLTCETPILSWCLETITLEVETSRSVNPHWRCKACRQKSTTLTTQTLVALKENLSLSIPCELLFINSTPWAYPVSSIQI